MASHPLRSQRIISSSGCSSWKHCSMCYGPAVLPVRGVLLLVLGGLPEVLPSLIRRSVSSSRRAVPARLCVGCAGVRGLLQSFRVRGGEHLQGRLRSRRRCHLGISLACRGRIWKSFPLMCGDPSPAYAFLV